MNSSGALIVELTILTPFAMGLKFLSVRGVGRIPSHIRMDGGYNRW